MTNNTLTTECLDRLEHDLISFQDIYRDPADRYNWETFAYALSALTEVRARRAADKNFFMYGIADPDGAPHFDENCVSPDAGLLEDEVNALGEGYRVVGLYTALPLTDSERAELQQYRKAESADREMLKRLAVILSGSDAPGEIRALTVTAQSFVDRCKLLAQERDKNGK